MTDREELFERWLSSLDIPLVAWQKELLRKACTQSYKSIYISLPRHQGRHMVSKLIEQFEQMIKEKEMSNKMKEFDMKDVHSGYVVKFRNGKCAMCTRVGDKFTKIFVRTALRFVDDVKEGVHFFYTSAYKGPLHYVHDPINSRTKPDPEHDIVEVYGLIHGVNNYLWANDIVHLECRPLLWKEDVVEMTLEEIEKKLGHKVKIVTNDPQPPKRTHEVCQKCVHDSDNECGHISCSTCKAKYGWDHCMCGTVKLGEPCPYFKEK